MFQKDGLGLNAGIACKTMTKLEMTEDQNEITEEILSMSAAGRWPEQLVDHLFSTVGDVVFVDSIKIELLGEMQFCVDMIAPTRQTTMIHALMHVCEAMFQYVQKDIGPIPPTWEKVKGDVRIPLDEILHLRVKTADIYIEPTEAQVEFTKGFKKGGVKFPAPSPNRHMDTDYEIAVPFFDDPCSCFIAFSGRYTKNFMYMKQAISVMKRTISARSFKRIESPAIFFNSLCVRFPNYYGVLLDMGWEEKDIPVDKDDLKKEFLDAYERVEIKTDAFLQEQLFRAIKRSPTAKEIGPVLRMMSKSVINKKAEAKTDRAAKKITPSAGEMKRPSWGDKETEE